MREQQTTHAHKRVCDTVCTDATPPHHGIRSPPVFTGPLSHDPRTRTEPWPHSSTSTPRYFSILATASFASLMMRSTILLISLQSKFVVPTLSVSLLVLPLDLV